MDDIQAKVEADYQLAQRLHDEEQEQYTSEKKARFFCEFLEQRRKFFTAKRVEAKRNKPPTQAQQKKLYSTYLKNMEGYTLKQLKGFTFEVIKDMFDRAFRRVNTFVDHEKELIEESSKKAENEKEISSKRKGEELESDKSKKQKLDEKVEAEVNDVKEAEELKSYYCSSLKAQLFQVNVAAQRYNRLTRVTTLLKIKTAEEGSPVKGWIKTEEKDKELLMEICMRYFVVKDTYSYLF
ncbi:hypothetical protein Tco_0539725 [Tanacetum coccineum]